MTLENLFQIIEAETIIRIVDLRVISKTIYKGKAEDITYGVYTIYKYHRVKIIRLSNENILNIEIME